MDDPSLKAWKKGFLQEKGPFQRPKQPRIVVGLKWVTQSSLRQSWFSGSERRHVASCARCGSGTGAPWNRRTTAQQLPTLKMPDRGGVPTVYINYSNFNLWMMCPFLAKTPRPHSSNSEKKRKTHTHTTNMPQTRNHAPQEKNRPRPSEAGASSASLARTRLAPNDSAGLASRAQPNSTGSAALSRALGPAANAEGGPKEAPARVLKRESYSGKPSFGEQRKAEESRWDLRGILVMRIKLHHQESQRGAELGG